MSVCKKQNDTQNFQNTSKFKNDKKTNSDSHSFNTESWTQSEAEFEPEIAEWRRAIPEDKNAIKELKVLTGDIPFVLFRRQNIDELIETTYFPIVQFDTKGDLVSFAAFDSFPDLQAMPFMWEDWLNINYKIKGITTGNVVFIHYMVWHPDYEEKFLPLLLETLFTEFQLVNHVIIVKPPNIESPEFLSKYFFSVLPSDLENLSINSVQLLLVCLRSAVIQPLYIRVAFEQEFDFIMSVIGDDFKKTKKDSTPHFWSFLQDFYEKDKKTLICELEGQIIGIMMLNLKMDLEVLNEWFELEPFNGLKKKDFDKQNAIGDSFSIPEIWANKEHKETKLISSEYLFSHMNWEMMLNKLQTKNSLFLGKDSDSSLNDSEFSQVSIFRLSSSYNSDDSSASSYQESGTVYKIGAFNLVIQTSESTTTRFFPPKCHGDSNAFVIDLFAIDCNKLHEKLSSFDFLKAAFRVVPDKDYCALLLPTDLIPFPLMDSFVRVTPRPTSNFKQELYLCHKNSLSILSISVRNTERQDLDQIRYFLKNVDEGDTVYQDILNKCFKESDNFKSFVLTFEDTIIGVSLLNSELTNENFYKYFEVAEIKYSSFKETEKFSVIQHLVINPVYHNHARFFVRDIMRLEAVNCLYYVYHKPCKNRPNLLTVLGELAPIKPKKKVGFTDSFGRNTEMDLRHECISLYFLNPRLCGFHKLHINIVLVVVGASRTALSFLESLIFGPESWLFKYNNIICITSNRLETSNTDKEHSHLMFVNYDSISPKYMSMLSLGTYVNFIYGIMTGINRSEKYIIVNNKAIVKYDYLILTCGLQFSTPTPEAKKEKERKKNCGNAFTSSLARFLPRKFASEKTKLYLPKFLNNLFVINTNSDAQNALRVLQILVQKLEKTGDKKIILYGHDLQVFLTIHTLLKLGIPGEFIVFVEPFPKGTITLFNDYAIDQAVIESVKNLKVSYYTNYILYDWSVSSEDYITSIKFHSHCKQLVIPCLAFFPFLEKIVSEVNFNACQDAGLVYDGRLVINHNFRTNDKYIYAAGPFTKYARRYFASEYNHQFFNSREVGQKLAEIIKRLISPNVEKKCDEEESSLVPQLKAPIVIHCQLPGDYNLFMLRKPGKELDLETAYNFYDYVNISPFFCPLNQGQVLTTGNCEMKNGYFRLHLNQEGFVESITCYAKQQIDYANLSSLYGLHEKILNNLLLRFDMAMIPDFFGYFRQPWAMALFHDDFQLLRDHSFKTFFKKIFENKSFYDKVTEELKANNWMPLPDSSIEELELQYLQSKIPEDVKNNLMQFLEHYKKDLPMYASGKRVKYMIKERLGPSFIQWISAHEA